ncbi:MAG: DUF4845 domain-containing protein [Acidobacteriia bacterium]|nr:DUF4845 domain-containing protein [Terriglobia bacterium]
MCQPERTGERGGSKLKLLFALAVMGFMIFSAWRMIPPYFANYQLQDAMETESRFALAAYPKKGEDEIREDIWTKMKELEVPGKREDIKVSVVNGVVEISLDYSVPIDLAVYQFRIPFHPHADNHTI